MLSFKLNRWCFPRAEINQLVKHRAVEKPVRYTQRTMRTLISESISEFNVPVHKFEKEADSDTKHVNSTRKHLKKRASKEYVHGINDADSFEAADLPLIQPGTMDKSNTEIPSNYDEMNYGVEKEHDYPSVSLRKKLVPFILEFFDSEDSKELYQSCHDACNGDDKDIMIPSIVLGLEVAMGRCIGDKENFSKLLVDWVSLYSVEKIHVERAFASVLSVLHELVVDIPQSGEQLAYFIARAVQDEVARPSFIDDHQHDMRLDVQNTIKRARSLLYNRHRSVILEHIWGGKNSVEHLTKQIRTCLLEYLDSSNIHEIEVEISEWKFPHFLHELVYCGMVVAFESCHPDDKIHKIHTLFSSLSKSKILPLEQLQIGFHRIETSMSELSLDIPKVSSLFQQFCNDAENKYKYYS